MSRLALIHPTGSPFAANAARAFAESSMLAELATTFLYSDSSALKPIIRTLAPMIHKELSRRAWFEPQDQSTTVSTFPLRELTRIALERTGLRRTLGLSSQRLADQVFLALDNHFANHRLGRTQAQAIYGYEDSCANTFSLAHERGMRCIYDLPILFYRTAYERYRAEAERFPEFIDSLDLTGNDEDKCIRKESELALADHIIVASSATRRSLRAEGINESRISVVPYGAPLESFRPVDQAPDKFRALFVGKVGPRKGVHYLLASWRELRLPNAELRLIGQDEFPSGWLQRACIESVLPMGSIRHDLLARHYATSSVFVFPSLVEGFGLVLLEAMAAGIPIITTSETAGPDLITDGVEGFLVPIRDSEALKDRIEWCYKNQSALREMGRAARKRAEEFPWSRYREELVRTVSGILKH